MDRGGEEFAARILKGVRERIAAEDKSGPRYALWREDDNGARFEVEAGLCKAVAESRVRELAHHAHKQHYWVEPEGA